MTETATANLASDAENLPEFESWDDVTKLWPSDVDFAAGMGVKANHLGTMKTRGKIGSDYWPAIIADAERRGIKGVTADRLLALQTHLKAATE